VERVHDRLAGRDGFITYEDPRGKYEFVHPATWSRTNILGGGLQPNSEPKAALYVTELPMTDPKDAVLDNIDELVKYSPHGVVLEHTPLDVGGRPGYAAHFVDDNEKGPGLVEAYEILVSEGSGGTMR
jgi:hypothetical protein